MKNLSHVGLNHYSSSSTTTTTTTNIIDDGGDLFAYYFDAYRNDEAASGSLLVVGADNSVFKGMDNNGAMENNGAESMVEAAAAAAEEEEGRRWDPRGSSEEYGGSDRHVLQPTVGFEMSQKAGAEWMARSGAPPGSRKQLSLSGWTEFASGGSGEGSSMFVFQTVGVEAPPQGMVVNKRGAADPMGGAAAAARGSKRQRSLSGSIEMASGGTNDGAGGGSRVSDEGSGKRLRATVRDGEWWETVSRPWYPEADFKRAFRMSRSTFAALCEMLAPAVLKEDTQMRAAIPVRKRVAVCVFRLSTGERLRAIGKRFRIGVATCSKLMHEVCAAINAILLPQVVLWPDATVAASVADKFQALTGGIPDVVGAVYTTHIPIIAPTHNAINYVNAGLTERNGKVAYSVRLQASVDADGAFTDVCADYPGAVLEEEVLLESSLKTRTVDTLGEGKRLVGGVGYPLMDWMLVPYSNQNLTHTQQEFNLKVAAARAVAVDAVQRLKTRWACLQKRTEIKVRDLPAIVSACCALHNFCQRSGDELDPELPNFELVDDDVVAPNHVGSTAAAQVRDAMANNFVY